MPRALSERMHIGIIMDGNGRWAERQHLPRQAGHRAGVEAVRRVAEAAPALGITTLTLYAFSVDNWRRPKAEVATLMQLLRRFLDTEIARLVDRDIRLRVIGRRDRLPSGLADSITRAEAATSTGQSLTLRIALDYSARDSILRAAGAVRNEADLTRAGFAQLISGEQEGCDVDLLIRTSGEQRLSDFLLWECAYAELYFTDRLWPDFDEADLKTAMESLRQRDRRFGGLTEDIRTAPAASLAG